MRTTFLSLVMCLCVVASSHSASGVGNSGSSPFEIGARAAAMGGAYTTECGDASVVFYNPAGVGGWDSLQLAGGYGYLSRKGFSGFGSVLFGKDLPRIGGRVGVGYYVAGIENVGGDAVRTGEAYDSSGRFGVISYGRQIEELDSGLTIGVSLKHARFRRFGIDNKSWETDLGVRYEHNAWTLAAVGRNLLDQDNGGFGDALRAVGVIGGAYTTELEKYSIKLRGVADYEALRKPGDLLHLGSEIEWMARDNLAFAFRFGLTTDFSYDRASVGGGIHWFVYDVGIDIDYAYSRLEDDPFLDRWGHTVSISVQPRGIVDWLRKKKPPPPSEPLVSVAQPIVVDTAQIVRDTLDAMFDEVFFRMATGFIAGELDSAIVAAYQLIPLATTPDKTLIAQYALELVRAERDLGLGIEPTEQPVAIDDKPVPPRPHTKEFVDYIGENWLLYHNLIRDLLDKLDSLELAAEGASYQQYMEGARECLADSMYVEAYWNIAEALDLNPSDSASLALKRKIEWEGCEWKMSEAVNAYNSDSLVSAFELFKTACDICIADTANGLANSLLDEIRLELERRERWVRESDYPPHQKGLEEGESKSSQGESGSSIKEVVEFIMRTFKSLLFWRKSG